MRGHGVTFPFGAGQTGGARGRLARWKVSMMTMRPPQHGQGGRSYDVLSCSVGAVGGGAPNRTLARSTLAFRPLLASRP
jgi:hypothetical protein